MDQKTKPEKAFKTFWWRNRCHQSNVETLKKRCLNFRSNAKWIWRKSLETPLTTITSAPRLQHMQMSTFTGTTAFTRNDLSIKVTSCKGRGNCCYFFAFLALLSTHTQAREPTNLLPSPWMWFDWFSRLLLSPRCKREFYGRYFSMTYPTAPHIESQWEA